MPQFQTDAEFEAYVAQQQAELAGAESEPAMPRQKTSVEQFQKILGLLVPLALVVLAGFFFWRNGPDGKTRVHDPWDTIFGAAAWAGGREYEPNARTLTDRMTFDKPLKKDD